MTYLLKVPDMSCKHCQLRIEGALRALSDVSQVKVDLDRKTVTIEGTIGLPEEIKAIEQSGYTVSEEK